MKFPNPNSANSDGLLAIGGDLNAESLISAYSQGIFPWPQEGVPILWFSPPQRGVLFFKDFKIPKTTQKTINRNTFDIRVNSQFTEVIKACAQSKRKTEHGTWILPEMIDAYVELHKAGKAISIEAWKEDELVGGLYGVLLKGVFSGESMFFKEAEASKVCLAYLVDYLKNLNLEWMDIQMVTPLLEKFGGKYISRQEFLKLLEKTQKQQG